ncbi:hypothetical protein BDZ97DRAFT_1766538 [Flammula alnicola]|nr:hypothetical protein BDZ97DRAFT_1766538 [Flammula alnicola]
MHRLQVICDIKAENERPAAIVKLRMEQAGYVLENGLYLLGAESLGSLLQFVFKSQLLAGEQIDFDNYHFVDLSGGGSTHNTAHILYDAARPPLNAQVDEESAAKLAALDLTSSPTPSEIHIHDLLTIHTQSNRLEKLPWHFARLRSLNTTNISNNKFRKFRIILTKIETLRDLDISMELLADIWKMKSLERLIIVGNQVSEFPDQAAELVNLRVLDTKRKQISDLTLICMLPQIYSLSADHDWVHALDLVLGPDMHTLVASRSDIIQLSLVSGPMSNPPYSLSELDLFYVKLSFLDNLVFIQLFSLRNLKLDHNSIRSIPDSLGDLKWLATSSLS